MDSFVDAYVDELEAAVGSCLPSDLRSDFDFVWLDYARVIVTGLWKRLSMEQMKR